MKHFIIDLQYTAPIEIINQVVDQHRQFLQTGYDKGWLLFSGPKEPRTGGVIVARAPSLEDIEEFFDMDPYKTQNCARHSFFEFDPVKYQSFIKDWVSGL